jgi:hypothetical protein
MVTGESQESQEDKTETKYDKKFAAERLNSLKSKRKEHEAEIEKARDLAPDLVKAFKKELVNSSLGEMRKMEYITALDKDVSPTIFGEPEIGYSILNSRWDSYLFEDGEIKKEKEAKRKAFMETLENE